MATKKIPPTRFPDAVAVTYQRQLIKLVREMGKMALRQFDATLKTYIKSYQADADELNWIQRTLDVIKALSLNIFSSGRILDIANRFVSNLNLFNIKNMNDQARVIGVNPIDTEPWIDDYIQSSIQQNVGYIKSIESTFFDKISAIIYEGTKNGVSTKEIRQQLVKQIGISESKAQFLAVDQSGTIHGQLTAKRHQEMGVKKFEWSTSHDERVRETHKALDGKVFDYSNPPSEGLPGTPYRCRCTAYPIFE